MFRIFLPGLFILLNSCSGFQDLMVGTNYASGIRVQYYYNSCCGRCAKRMIYDDFQGTLQTWFLPYDFNGSFCSKGPNRMVVHYRNRKIVRIEEFRPVYDTSILKLYVEKQDISNWIDTNYQYDVNFIPLNSTDSLLVYQLSKSFNEEYANINYTKAIKGYFYVGDLAIIKGSHRKTNYKKLRNFGPEDF